MTIKYILSVIFLSIFLLSCSTDPVAIDYHTDQCADCKMMISDSRFGAELVTKKGKIFKYDAIECMIRAYISQGESEFAHVMVTDFNSPSTLINAKESTYLVSTSRPSPMGGNLSGYYESSSIDKTLLHSESVILDWDGLVQHYEMK